MCGIIGLVSGARPASGLELQLLRHRGPDGSGHLRVGNATLGHTRLSIIDLEGGAQPMSSGDGQAAIAFNGEIYNYRELRSELSARGYAFGTASDTEVVLAIYQVWGIKGFSRLRGMYAFALADRRTGETVLARDPFGIKPLFYHSDKGAVLFASEVGALIGTLGRTPEIDRTSVLETLVQRYPIGDHSLYSTIKRLSPGTALVIAPDGGLRSEVFSSIAEAVEREREASKPIDADAVRALVADSVVHHAIADVPLGCFLSGGLDSSIIAQQLAQFSSEPIRAYSVIFASTHGEHSEFPYAREMAEHIGASLTEVSVSGDDFAALAPLLSGSANGPFPDPADVAMFKMARVAAGDVKVALSGEGADEAFAGYPKYAFDRYARLVPKGLRGLLPYQKLGRAGIALDALDEKDRTVRWMRWFQNEAAPPELVRSLISDGADPVRAVGWVRKRLDHYPAQWSDLQRMQVLDLESWLPNNLLHRGDYTTMQASLEQRVPFLDIELTPRAVALPDSAKVHLHRGKEVLRRAFAADLPRSIVKRRKSGFRLPLGDWLGQPGQLRSLVHDTLLSPNAVVRDWLEREDLQQLMGAHNLATTKGAKLAWTVLSLELWLLSLRN